MYKTNEEFFEAENKLKGSIHPTSLPILKIDKRDIYGIYPQIGHGCEGSIHKYDEETALKLFMFIDKTKLDDKYKKIEELAKYSDESFCFPKGLVCYENEYREGYYTDLVIPDKKLTNIERLISYKDIKKKIDILIKANDAIERIHELGFVIGDLNTDNIMINEEGEPKFVDVDNYKFDGFNHDLYPTRRDWFKEVFAKDCSDIDSDKFLYAMVALQTFAMGTLLRMARSKMFFEMLIGLLNIDEESKEILEAIFSDAENKPYIGPVLRKIKTEENLLPEDYVGTLNRYYYR